jgi:hypothetical protein
MTTRREEMERDLRSLILRTPTEGRAALFAFLDTWAPRSCEECAFADAVNGPPACCPRWQKGIEP